MTAVIAPPVNVLADCRDNYAKRETTWRLTRDQKRDEWATGCGWCGQPIRNHAEFRLAAAILTPDAATAGAR